MALQINATNPEHPALLLELPWHLPLEEWPDEYLVPLPRGISRHVVRYARAGDEVVAVKELAQRPALREYELLRDLDRIGIPAVDPLAVVTGRTDPDGGPLECVLITRHLGGSMPYRSMFETTMRPATMHRLMDALAVLLVRLHLAGFAWGDCSLSNTLFRRDAGAFAAYLVDAETGEMHPMISEGQRLGDIDTAHTNIYGEMLDLEAGGLLHPSIDPMETAEDIVTRYHRLWNELNESEIIEEVDWHRVEQRIRRLNQLGFDVAEMMVRRKVGTGRLIVRPKVVDAGHHQRRLLRLTGLDVEENQARRLLNDLDGFRVAKGLRHEDEAIVAHRWLAEVFQPTVEAIPVELRGKLEPAQIFHEILDHRWFLSEQEGADVGLAKAVESYVENILVHKPDEQALLPDDAAPGATATPEAPDTPQAPDAADATDTADAPDTPDAADAAKAPGASPST